MLTEAKIQRVGGSTFARLSPEVVKALGLRPGDVVQLNILKRGMTLGELQRYAELHPWTAEEKKRLEGWKDDFRGSKYD